MNARSFFVSAAVAAGLFAVGCGATHPPLQHARAEETTAIYVINRVTPPLALRRIRVAVDHDMIGEIAGDDVGGGADELLRVASSRLAEGAHTLSIHVKTATPNGEDVLVADETYPIHVEGQPASIVASISTPGRSVSSRRLRVSLKLDGVTPGAPTVLPASRDGACPEGSEEVVAMCKTEQLLAQARAERDPVRVVCVDDSLRQMRALWRGSRLSAVSNERSTVAFRLLVIAERASRCPSARINADLLKI